METKVIGVIGAGAIGTAFTKQALKAGYQVILSNSRGPESLAGIISELGSGVSAGKAEDAVKADVVVLSVKWGNVEEVLKNVPAWKGQILIDTANAVVAVGDQYQHADLGGKPSSEVVSELAPGARVVKAFNTLTPELLSSDPHVSGGNRVLFMSGNDAEAKAEVLKIMKNMGFSGVDLGSLETGGKLQQFPGGSIPGLNLIKLP